MAKKSYTVVSAVRVNGKRYAEGAQLQCEPEAIDGIEHCVTEGKRSTRQAELDATAAKEAAEAEKAAAVAAAAQEQADKEAVEAEAAAAAAAKG